MDLLGIPNDNCQKLTISHLPTFIATKTNNITPSHFESTCPTPTHDEEYHEPLLDTRYWEEDDALDLTLKSLPVPFSGVTITSYNSPPSDPLTESTCKNIITKDPRRPHAPAIMSSPCQDYKGLQNSTITEEDPRNPHAHTNMSSPNQEEED